MGMFDELIERTDRAALEFLGSNDETMTYAPSVGPAIANIKVIFDDDTGTQKPYQQQAEHPRPRVWFRLSDVAPNDPYNDEPTLTIRGQNYRIHQRPTDGQIGGTIHLRLHKL